LAPQIFAFVKKAIKDGVHRFALGLLEQLESGNTLLVKDNHLTIEKQSDWLKNPDCGRNSREVFRSVFFISGEQPDPALFFICKDPDAVILLLIGPPGPNEWLGNEGSKHGLNAKWNPVRHGDCFLSSICPDTQLALIGLPALPASVEQPSVVIGTKAIWRLWAATYALADLRFLRFTGFSAWIVWAAVHIYFLIGFANRFFVILQWGIAFLTKRRQVRVFPGEENSAKAA
jgi:hypothetical protein